MFNTKMYVYLQPTNLAPNDIVWIRWEHMIRGDLARQATPTVVIKVYDDGNIIHKRPGYDNKEFAFAENIYAKSPQLPLQSIKYRRVPISEILIGLQETKDKELNNND